MLSKAIEWFIKWKYGKQALGWVKTANEKVSGYRSEILIGLLAALFVAEKIGVAPAGSFESTWAYLATPLPLTMAEKVKKAFETADKIIPDAPKPEEDKKA